MLMIYKNNKDIINYKKNYRMKFEITVIVIAVLKDVPIVYNYCASAALIYGGISFLILNFLSFPSKPRYLDCKNTY